MVGQGAAISPAWVSRVETLLIAAAGTVVFWAFDLPLPFLFGPMFACLMAALARRRLTGMGQASVGARTILGVAVGASITPQVVSMLPQMAVSVALVPLYIFIIALIGVPYFYRVWGFDFPTAWYAAMPGGFQDMILFGTEAGGDTRSLSLIHATRVLLIVTIAPVILVTGFGASIDNPIGAPILTMPVQELAWMIFAALFGWKFGERIGLFGASMIGPMIVAAILSLSGFIHTRPPAEVIVTAQFMIGLGLGVGYVGVTLHELRRSVLSGVVYVLILAILAAFFTWLVVSFGLAPPIEGFLAFSPGGQAEMIVLSILIGADLGFAAVHHLARVFIVIIGAPLAARWFQRKSK